MIALLLYDYKILIGVVGAVSWLIGLVSGLVALATMRRFGRNGILRPAVIGLCFTVAVLLLLGFGVMMLLNGLAGDVR